jgi:hypothetical protein
LISFATSLSEKTTSANAGNLIGNRMFYASDYMVCVFHAMKVLEMLTSLCKVHRGSNYVSTLKMYSNRTKNAECTNSQNVSPCNFAHLIKTNTADFNSPVVSIYLMVLFIPIFKEMNMKISLQLGIGTSSPELLLTTAQPL